MILSVNPCNHSQSQAQSTSGAPAFTAQSYRRNYKHIFVLIHLFYGSRQSYAPPHRERFLEKVKVEYLYPP